MRWRPSSHVRPALGFIEPCLPTIAKQAPTGPDWVYELKHDGYRLLVRRDGSSVRIYSRNGANFTDRFPRIVEAVRRLRVRSVLLDGEGIVYNGNGMPDFRLLHGRLNDAAVTMIAFDTLEIDGDNLRSSPMVERKKHLARLLSKVRDGIEYNDHLVGDGRDIYAAACELGHEGIIAKRRDLPYQSGRSKRWLKVKNPNAPAAWRIKN